MARLANATTFLAAVASICGASILAAGCGRIGFELLAVESTEAGVRPPIDAGRPSADDASSAFDGRLEFDASEHEAGALDDDASVGSDGAVDPDSGGRDGALDAGPATDAGPDACVFSGTWATKITLPATWPGSSFLAAGSGSLYFWLRLRGTHSNDAIVSTLQLCGMVVPDFASGASAGSETYGVTFDDSLFDREPASLSFPLTITTTGSSPGAGLTAPKAAALVGVSLSDPFVEPWPATITPVDVDQDSKPGITAPFKPAPWQYVRLSLDAAPPRADQSYGGSRLLFSLAGNFTSCSTASGAASASYDSRVFGCRVNGVSRDCTTGTSSEAAVLDGNRPLYAPSGSTFSARRVADAASCAEVRAALP